MKHDIIKQWKYEGLDCQVIKVTDLCNENFMRGLGFFDMGVSSSWHCGYVGVKSTNKLFGLDYYADKIENLDVHGGITFAEKGNKYLDANLWWFGFDCAHYGDDGCWDEEDVVEETEQLAKQIASLTKKTGTKTKTSIKVKAKTKIVSKPNTKTKTVAKKKKEKK